MKRTSFPILLFLIVTLSGCSSIINGSKCEVTVHSRPNNAVITVDGNKIGTTPAILRFKRGSTHMIEVSKDGYSSAKIHTEKLITGWFWGNLICGGLVGIAIDLSTGNAYEADPEIIKVVLEPNPVK